MPCGQPMAIFMINCVITASPLHSKSLRIASTIVVMFTPSRWASGTEFNIQEYFENIRDYVSDIANVLTLKKLTPLKVTPKGNCKILVRFPNPLAFFKSGGDPG